MRNLRERRRRVHRSYGSFGREDAYNREPTVSLDQTRFRFLWDCFLGVSLTVIFQFMLLGTGQIDKSISLHFRQLPEKIIFDENNCRIIGQIVKWSSCGGDTYSVSFQYSSNERDVKKCLF
ncbi:hypothetical protein YC2023_072474 [Brassica napus]